MCLLGHEDMPGIDNAIIKHHLYVDIKSKKMRKKHRSFNVEICNAIVDEVDHLLATRFFREAHYLEWLSNVVLVKKSSEKWRMCIDFTKFNKACQVSFPLPPIDVIVDSNTKHKMLSFMDAYSGYNQIQMNPENKENTSFILD